MSANHYYTIKNFLDHPRWSQRLPFVTVATPVMLSRVEHISRSNNNVLGLIPFPVYEDIVRKERPGVIICTSDAFIYGHTIRSATNCVIGGIMQIASLVKHAGHGRSLIRAYVDWAQADILQATTSERVKDWQFFPHVGFRPVGVVKKHTGKCNVIWRLPITSLGWKHLFEAVNGQHVSKQKKRKPNPYNHVNDRLKELDDVDATDDNPEIPF